MSLSLSHSAFFVCCGITLTLLAACTPKQPTAEWIEGETEANGQALQTLVLRNVPEGSRVWFQELFDGKTVIEGPEIHHYQGTSWYIDIPDETLNSSKNTVTLKYYGRPLPRRRWAPEAFILQQKGEADRPMKINYHFQEIPPVEPTYEVKPCDIRPTDIIPQIKHDVNETPPDGWYRISIDTNGATSVEANDEDGAFYAQITLNKLSQSLYAETPSVEFPMIIEDWPDYPFRGFMLDVARDFRTVDDVYQILDLMASWKMNVLHFHLADDESWCLEIKDLPDLTEFGGRHALPDRDLQETKALKPTINGRIGNATFYTSEEYQQILKYAWERRIRVIPEFDTPGHSRASIKAMQAYERRTGDASYRLQDPADTSHYWSAQDFTDNVLSVDLPSVYKFYGLVFDEVIRLHQEAGVPLPAIHIGGDEVPMGAWSGKDRHEMKEIFTNGMLDLAETRGIRLAGWEDICHDLEPQTERRLKQSLYYVDVWNSDGIEGFPVVLSPASYTYLDLAYSNHPSDIGLHWAGYVDERKAFSFMPDEYKGEILGMQASLWSSQLRSFDDATYQMLPKALSVAERGWNTHTDDFSQFYNIITKREIPVWIQKGLVFRSTKH